MKKRNRPHKNKYYCIMDYARPGVIAFECVEYSDDFGFSSAWFNPELNKYLVSSMSGQL